MDNLSGYQFIDWNAKGVPLPKVLDLCDKNNFLQSNALFARKFRKCTSDEVLSLVQKAINLTE